MTLEAITTPDTPSKFECVSALSSPLYGDDDFK
jgi:hypothetical protein